MSLEVKRLQDIRENGRDVIHRIWKLLNLEAVLNNEAVLVSMHRWPQNWTQMFWEKDMGSVICQFDPYHKWNQLRWVVTYILGLRTRFHAGWLWHYEITLLYRGIVLNVQPFLNLPRRSVPGHSINRKNWTKWIIGILVQCIPMHAIHCSKK